MLDQDRLSRFQESKEYRASYTTGRVRLAIATQIRALREQFSTTQDAFAEKIGKPQSVISRLENPDYGKMSVQTLLDIAEALDITLVVKFMSYDKFFTLLDDKDVSLDALRVESFAETVWRHEQIKTSANVYSLGVRTKLADEIINEHAKEPELYRREPSKTALAKATERVDQRRPSLSDQLGTPLIESQVSKPSESAVA